MEPPPDALPDKEMPYLDEVETMYWQHFQELQSERPLGGMGGAGAIPWSSIDRYAERFGFIGDAYMQFVSIIRFLDNLWLKAMHDKQEKEKAKNKSKPKSNSRPARRR